MRTFGNTGLRVSEMFLGAMGFADERSARELVDRYADLGGNVLDTAVNYQQGESERVLGAILQKRRDRFVVGTKYTCSRDVTNPNAAGNHRANLNRSLETSLRRLRTDYVDIFWVHVHDRHTPIEETMRALDDAVRAGKVNYVGISDSPAWLVAQANTLAQWRDWTPFAGIQVPYNVLDRDVERELVPMAAALGLSVTAWGPLAHGALTKDGGDARTQAAVDAITTVAGEIGASRAQVALGWLRAKGVHPIVGASSPEQLADSLSTVDLSAAQVTSLDNAVPFTRGFPADFVDECEESEWVFGNQRVG